MKTAKEALNPQFSRYADSLRSVQWKQWARIRRNRANNACELCRKGGATLHVHHWWYVKGKEPWEAEEGQTVVLCETCHEALHTQLQHFRKYVFPHLNKDTFRILNGALSVGLTQHDPLKLVYAIAEMVSYPGSVERFSAAWTPRKQTDK